VFCSCFATAAERVGLPETMPRCFRKVRYSGGTSERDFPVWMPKSKRYSVGGAIEGVDEGGVWVLGDGVVGALVGAEEGGSRLCDAGETLCGSGGRPCGRLCGGAGRLCDGGGRGSGTVGVRPAS
jgi:hypothetical protein